MGNENTKEIIIVHNGIKYSNKRNKDKTKYIFEDGEIIPYSIYWHQNYWYTIYYKI
jgi:hypothetical protein